MIFFISVMIYFKKTIDSHLIKKKKITSKVLNRLNNAKRIGIANYKNSIAVHFGALNKIILSNKLSPKNLKKIAFINHVMRQSSCFYMINHHIQSIMTARHREILDRLFNGVNLEMLICQISDQRSLCHFPVLYIPKCQIQTLECKLYCCYELAHDELMEQVTEILNSQCNHIYIQFVTKEDRQYVLNMLSDLNTNYTIIDDEGEIEILR